MAARAKDSRLTVAKRGPAGAAIAEIDIAYLTHSESTAQCRGFVIAVAAQPMMATASLEFVALNSAAQSQTGAVSRRSCPDAANFLLASLRAGAAKANHHMWPAKSDGAESPARRLVIVDRFPGYGQAKLENSEEAQRPQ